MIAIEARRIGVCQALQALLVQVRELELIPINPVEDTKLHWRRIRVRLPDVINHRVTSVRPWRDRAREAVSERSPAPWHSRGNDNTAAPGCQTPWWPGRYETSARCRGMGPLVTLWERGAAGLTYARQAGERR